MKRSLYSLGWACCLVALSPAASADVTIKLGTMAPKGSRWHSLVVEAGERMAQETNGGVKLKIFAGGVAGDEGDMVRKMRIGQLQAAALTVVGLGSIEPSPQAISAPGLIADEAEWEHVFGKMQPIWRQRLLAKGFEVLFWGDTGWFHMFLKKKVNSPKEMKGMKVYAWSGDPAAVEAWKAAGFQPVIISSVDIIPSLSTGMIESVAGTPIMGMSLRWYEKAPYMTKDRWAHLPGAIVVATSAWDKIPAEQQAKVKAIGAEYTKKLGAEVTRMEADAIAAMKKNGLTLIEFTPEQQKEWVAMGDRAAQIIRGKVVSVAEFDEVKKVRDEYRAKQPK